jgi:glycosyltransferase involved in cell wall biosynthesis
MRVLVVSSLFPTREEPNSGIFIKEQLKHIKQQCCVIGVVSPKPWKPLAGWKSGRGRSRHLAEEEQWEGIAVHHLKYFMVPKLTVYLNWLFYYWSVSRFIRRRGWQQRFDVLHVHFAYPAGFAGVLLGKRLRKAVILTVRGSDINHFPKHAVLRALIKYSLKAVAGVIAVSDDLKQKVVDLGLVEEKVKVIPNGVDLDVFRPMSKTTARAQLDLGSWDKIVLYVGSLEAVKGIDSLLHAFRELRELERGRRILLVVIGQGTLQCHMQRMIDTFGMHDCVLWQPYVPHDEIPVWMNASDVLCLTSLSEGRPNVLYEAMACGLPVVASSVGGVPEMVCSDQLGELVPAGNVPEIREAMRRVLEKVWDAQAIRRYALEHSSSTYAQQVVAMYAQWANGTCATNRAVKLSKSLSCR